MVCITGEDVHLWGNDNVGIYELKDERTTERVLMMDIIMVR